MKRLRRRQLYVKDRWYAFVKNALFLDALRFSRGSKWVKVQICMSERVLSTYLRFNLRGLDQRSCQSLRVIVNDLMALHASDPQVVNLNLLDVFQTRYKALLLLQDLETSIQNRQTREAEQVLCKLRPLLNKKEWEICKKNSFMPQSRRKQQVKNVGIL